MKIWNFEQITEGHKNFDVDVFEERRIYLLSLDEQEAQQLSPQDWYDRMRFNRQMEVSKRRMDNDSEKEISLKERFASMVKRDVKED